MRINKSKIIISIVVFLLIINLWLPTHATGIDATWRQAGRFIQTGESASDVQTFNGTNVKEAAMGLYDFFWWIGLAAAAIIGTFLGIKFMTSGIEGKAKVKEALIVFVVGCIVIFGAFTIWKIAMKLFNEVEEETKIAGYVASNPSSTGTVFNTGECEPGHHIYSKLSNFYCSKCSKYCEHKNLSQNGGKMVCNNCKTEFPMCGVPTEAGGRGISTTHVYVAGRCDYCGKECNHVWTYYNHDVHKCTQKDGCGIYENHDWVATGQSHHICSKCGRNEGHTEAYDGANDRYYCYYCGITISK